MASTNEEVMCPECGRTFSYCHSIAHWRANHSPPHLRANDIYSRKSGHEKCVFCGELFAYNRCNQSFCTDENCRTRKHLRGCNGLTAYLLAGVIMCNAE